MNESPDIEQLLRQTAPPLPAPSAASIHQLQNDIEMAVASQKTKRLIVAVYGLLSLLVCLSLMLACSLSWWLIACSMVGSFLLIIMGWQLVQAIL